MQQYCHLVIITASRQRHLVSIASLRLLRHLVIILLILLHLIPTFMWGRCTMTYASM